MQITLYRYMHNVALPFELKSSSALEKLQFEPIGLEAFITNLSLTFLLDRK